MTPRKSSKVKEIKFSEEQSSAVSEFVFMEKSAKILEAGFATGSNIVLYGPGGHGKSEITMAFFQDKGINPYVITMGTGMTTDRMFGGLDIKTFENSGKIEYLVENSFMNHEYVIFEEMFDAPDFILEQLKDILSSGVFRNGTQVYPIKTKFIVCCTNRTREEFSKNMSLRALMERFPLELNVIWDNYTDLAYKTLLDAKFGERNVDPVIPYILQNYAKNNIVISPRVAIKAYEIYTQCGPEALGFIAEFAKKPALIATGLKEFQAQAEFRTLSELLQAQALILQKLHPANSDEAAEFTDTMAQFNTNMKKFKALKVGDELADTYSKAKTTLDTIEKMALKKVSIATTALAK